MKSNKSREKTRGSSLWQSASDFWPIVLTVIGTTALAYAAVLQVTRSPETAEAKTRLQRSQLVVQIAETERDQWNIALNQEVTRGTPNQAMVRAAALQLVETTARWRAFMAMRVAHSPTDYDSAIAERETIIATARKLYDTGDAEHLLKLAQTLSSQIRDLKEVEQLDDKFFKDVDETNAEDTKVSRNITTFYIIGSTLMLISVVASTLQTNKVLTEIRTSL
jgi:hypothetical protein